MGWNVSTVPSSSKVPENYWDGNHRSNKRSFESNAYLQRKVHDFDLNSWPFISLTFHVALACRKVRHTEPAPKSSNVWWYCFIDIFVRVRYITISWHENFHHLHGLERVVSLLTFAAHSLSLFSSTTIPSLLSALFFNFILNHCLTFQK